MKRVLLLCFLSFAFKTFSQNVGINGTAATPDPSAMLDVSAINKGLLIPRVALTAANVAGPVTSPLTSLLIYNTATAGTSPNDVVPGFYFWDGSKWQRFVSSTFLNAQAFSAIGKFYATLSWGGNWLNGTALTFTITDANVVYGSQVSQINAGFYGTSASIPGLAIRNTRVSTSGQWQITVVNNTGGTLTGSFGIVYTAFY
jgi:hypothetical protein